MTDSEHTSNNKGLTKRHLIVKGFQETANDQFHYINVTSVEEIQSQTGVWAYHSVQRMKS